MGAFNKEALVGAFPGTVKTFQRFVVSSSQQLWSRHGVTIPAPHCMLDPDQIHSQLKITVNL